MSRGSILVVDDESSARSALDELLSAEGYQVTTAGNGLEAMGSLVDAAPDVVLTDLKMPGMGGLDLLRNLRALKNDAVVIVMTAFGALDTAVLALKEGAADYLTKPVDIDQLLLVVGREMERRALRREAEEAKLRLLAANRDLEAFAARVAHDLRAPLAPISLLAGVLKLQSRDPRIAGTADRIVAGIRRASDMIEGLLTFSRTGRYGAEGVTVAAALIRQSLEDHAGPIADGQVTVEVDLDAAGLVNCSASLFREIVDNLVSNALKHLDGGERRWMKVGLVSQGGHVELEVQDSGPGIPPHALERIFDLFYRVPNDPAPGSGIGLATVRRIVEAQNGQIMVRSEVGQGASFRVRLPAATVAPVGEGRVSADGFEGRAP
jgi:signal transduction histidine kinase